MVKKIKKFPNKNHKFSLLPSEKNIKFNQNNILHFIQKAIEQPTLGSMRQQVELLMKEISNLNVNNQHLQSNDYVTNQQFVTSELAQILKTQTLERGRYYLKRLLKSLTETKTSNICDINLRRWKEYSDIITDSLWIIKKRDNTGVHTAGYWGNFIPQIPYQMIQRYTKRGEWILDTFAGCGTTLIESQRLGRNSIGVELQEDVVNIANKLIKSEFNQFATFNEVVQGDSLNINYEDLLGKYLIKKVQLIIMHPPYFDIIKFSKDPRDLSNLSSVNDFIKTMGLIVERASKYLDKGRFLIIVIGDKYSKGEWIPLGFLLMQEVLSKGFLLKSIIVKNFEDTTAKRNQKELWRYRAIVGGFYVFKHEYILVFRRK